MILIVISLEEDEDETNDTNGLSMPSCSSNAHRREKKSRPIVDFFHSLCLVASYDILFAKYCEGCKQITQRVLNIV